MTPTPLTRSLQIKPLRDVVKIRTRVRKLTEHIYGQLFDDVDIAAASAIEVALGQPWRGTLAEHCAGGRGFAVPIFGFRVPANLLKRLIANEGWVAEWFKAPVLKTEDTVPSRTFQC
jgi:hypothetical protein